MADTLSIIASLLGCASMTVYFVQVVRGGSIPNPVTWLIWLIIGMINAATYFLVVHGSWIRSLTLVVVTTGILAVTLYSLIRGKFSKLKPLDLGCLVFAVAIGVLWRTSGNPAVANLLLQGVYAVSFVPTVIGLQKRELRENPWPWVLALGAYSLMILAVCLTWGPGSWIALAHPIVNGLLGNGAVAFYAIRDRNRASGEGKDLGVPRKREEVPRKRARRVASAKRAVSRKPLTASRRKRTRKAVRLTGLLIK